MSKKVTFLVSAEVAGEATEGLLLGDFNNWDFNEGIILKKQNDGSLKVNIALEAGKTYQYRYLLNDGRWVNDNNAEAYAHVNDYQVHNCVITVPAEEATEKVAKPKKTAAKAKKEKTAESAPKAEDLTKIEGIGRKIAELLKAEKIDTFKELSKASEKKLRGILDNAGSKFKVHNPATWPAQAKLAANSKWEDLKTLQAELKGGK